MTAADLEVVWPLHQWHYLSPDLIDMSSIAENEVGFATNRSGYNPPSGRSKAMLRSLALAAFLTMSVVMSPVGAQGNAAIVGTWKVISEEMEFQDNGERQHPLGAHPDGYIIFTPQSRMMAYLEAEGRKLPTTDAEAAAAFSTMSSYTGKYRVEGNKWITKVDGAWNVV